MKKWVALIFAGLIALGLAACGSTSSTPASATPSSAVEAPSSESEQMPGGYTEERELTDADLEVFNVAMENLVGATYEPLKVATQVVNGTNYRFYAKKTTVTAEPEESYVYVYIYQSLDASEKPTITEIVDAE
ncbi:MAG: hypothetical protein GXY32_00855 [Ruminococcaceae bacterium]|nr:hypothetical protein [Oscillospiraceae bacterium]